jgi:phenylacetate-CoA ligase
VARQDGQAARGHLDRFAFRTFHGPTAIDLLRIYGALPTPLRSIAASARGLQLRTWRYGRDTERLVQDAIGRERWSAEQWKRWTDERTAFLLHRAATRVPYYREQWARRRRAGDRSSWEQLENWPILDKAPLRTEPRAFVAEDCDIRRMFPERTSGTSGTSLLLWWSRETVRFWYALLEARWRRWYGVTRHDRWAILGGHTVVPFDRTAPPFWVHNVAMNQLYMSSYHLAEELMGSYLDALVRYRVRYVWAYTSSVYALAQYAIRHKRRDVRFAVAIANAEPLFDYQRHAIAEAFQCPVRETYGMSEIVAAASECAAGRLHLWPEAGRVELIDGGEPAGSGQSGDLVATGLVNADMPLIRYRVGDRARLPVAATPCECGRLLPTLAAIEGRIDDVLYTAEGRTVGRLDPVFKAPLPVCEAQIIQESLEQVRVRFVPAPGFTTEAGRLIEQRLRARLGDISIVLEAVDRIERGANGKFKAVVCRVPRPVDRSIAGGVTLCGQP